MELIKEVSTKYAGNIPLSLLIKHYRDTGYSSSLIIHALNNRGNHTSTGKHWEKKNYEAFLYRVYQKALNEYERALLLEGMLRDAVRKEKV